MSTAARMSTVTKDTENENTMATVAGKLNTYLEAYGELTAERQERIRPVTAIGRLRLTCRA